MKPKAFDYIRADSLDEAVSLLHEAGSDARIMAGGQSLMAALNMRLAQPSVLIDISRTSDLNYVQVQNGFLCIGAAATQASVEWRSGLLHEVPLLCQVFPHISHFQIRNRGTVCGSVAHADPSAELPLALLALEGNVVLRGRKGPRMIAADDFFQGMMLTARQPDELVQEVQYPIATAGCRYAFDEFSERHGDFAIASVAVVVSGQRIRVAVGGVSDRPRALEMDRSSDITAELNDFAWSLDAADDHHASARYKRNLVRRLGEAVIEKALS